MFKYIFQKITRCIKQLLKTIIINTFMIIQYAWQFMGIIVLSILENRPWELSFILIGFWIGKFYFGTTNVHAPSFAICTAITWSVFWVLLSTSPSFGTSMLLPACLGVLSQYGTMIFADVMSQTNINNTKEE